MNMGRDGVRGPFGGKVYKYILLSIIMYKISYITVTHECLKFKVDLFPGVGQLTIYEKYFPARFY